VDFHVGVHTENFDTPLFTEPQAINHSDHTIAHTKAARDAQLAAEAAAPSAEVEAAALAATVEAETAATASAEA
jgi:hypothetical protein